MERAARVRTGQSVFPGQLVNLALRHRALHAGGDERRQADQRLLNDFQAAFLRIVCSHIAYEPAVHFERNDHERLDALDGQRLVLVGALAVLQVVHRVDDDRFPAGEPLDPVIDQRQRQIGQVLDLGRHALRAPLVGVPHAMAHDVEDVGAIGLQELAHHAQHRVERRIEIVVLQNPDAFDVQTVRACEELERFLLAVVIGYVERDLEARLLAVPVDQLVAQQVVMLRDGARVLPFEERAAARAVVRAERAGGRAVLQRGVAQVRSVGDVLAVSLFAGLVDEQQLIGVGVADVHELGQSVEERIYCELHERPSLSPMCQYAL